MLNGSDIKRFVVVIVARCIPGDDGRDGGQARAFIERTRNEHVPMLEAILPGIKLGVATLTNLAGQPLRVHAWPVAQAALIAQCQGAGCHALRPKGAFMHEEG